MSLTYFEQEQVKTLYAHFNNMVHFSGFKMKTLSNKGVKLISPDKNLVIKILITDINDERNKSNG